MGGEIGLRSTQGVGSEFWFSLALKLQAGDAASDDLAALAQRRVLVVDDNETSRHLLMAWLGSWKMRHSAVASGADALVAITQARAEGDPFVVSLLDMLMPGLDGIQLAQRIRQSSAQADLKLILVSSVENLRDQAALTKVGFADSLAKPVSPTELRKILRQHLVQMPAPTLKIPSHMASKACRILLVEDGEIKQLVARGMLDTFGCFTDIANNGAEALRALAERDYDIVLMDVQMPVMGGREATRKLRQPGSAVRIRDIPVIAMTTYAMADELQQCLQAGMNAHLTKPITRDALHGMLQRFSSAARASQPA